MTIGQADKNKGGRPKGKSPKLPEVLLRAEDMVAIQFVADQTGQRPQQVASWLIHAALWRTESVLAEVSRLALDEGRKVQSPASSEPEYDNEDLP
jgi:hypothetical protein